jgi:hypothetical protein
MNLRLKYGLYWFGSNAVVGVLYLGTGSKAVVCLVLPIMAMLVYGYLKEWR